MFLLFSGEMDFSKLGMKHSRSATMLDKGHVETEAVKQKKPDAEKTEKKHHHRHHHKKHHHARHLKNKGLTAQDTLESRIRSGMHALEEERKALKEIVEEMDENIGERDREDITSKKNVVNDQSILTFSFRIKILLQEILRKLLVLLVIQFDNFTYRLC